MLLLFLPLIGVLLFSVGIFFICLFRGNADRLGTATLGLLLSLAGTAVLVLGFLGASARHGGYSDFQGLVLIGIALGLFGASAKLSSMALSGGPTDAAPVQSAGAVVPVVPAGYGTCPNCDAPTPVDAASCSRCSAMFGPDSVWKVRPPIGK